MKRIRVIDTKQMKMFFGKEALELANGADTENLIIDNLLGFDKEGKEVYERDFVKNRQEVVFLATNHHIKILNTLTLVGNSHRDNLERLF
ncbi:hypothetical protein LS66_009635 [Helicobacter sp. MIT 03-1614]|uniref:hypothetical protein n=1 Tax=Helicobacter TaxID=209 RepID=UPI0005142AE0|nr:MULTISPECIES: hypothetical protein [Helicobacter]TLD86274.1 hypothetical protein LS66_009635 [Helicobacter sp. MIT 03-1614]TLD89716.1 hypothetical protein LS67_001420 [Helicobacter sp. MIT 03-1616]